MQVLLVTGATGVMMASYVVPVVNHLLLYFGKCGCRPLVLVAVLHFQCSTHAYYAHGVW